MHATSDVECKHADVNLQLIIESLRGRRSLPILTVGGAVVLFRVNPQALTETLGLFQKLL